MSDKRYCIGCKHLEMQSEDLAMGSTLTGPYGDSFELKCSIGHWWLDTRNDTREGFSVKMETAATCKDFDERETP